jgi:ubiquinone/menaquinone biosynthesis C-methylase UbiE
MPFADGTFDLVICQAAFKNFSKPARAIDEMYRVLRPGGTAVIQDLRRDASDAEIEREVDGMQLGRLTAFTTRATLHMLRRRAYSPADFEELAARSAFGACTIRIEGIGVEVRLHKR